MTAASEPSVSGSEWAAVLAAQVCLVALVVLVVVIVRLDRAATDLRGPRSTSGAEAEPRASPSCARSLRDADYEVDRVDAHLAGAESVGGPGRRRVATSPTAPSPTRW